MSELDYEQGSRAAWLHMLGECIRQLGYDDPESRKVGWIKERDAAVAALRSICDLHGDNDWDDDLHLADVIEKHLARPIEERTPEGTSVSWGDKFALRGMTFEGEAINISNVSSWRIEKTDKKLSMDIVLDLAP